MGSTDFDCSVDILSLLNQLDVISEMSLPSPVESVYTSPLTSFSPLTSAMNGGALPPLPSGSRRRPQLCSAISLPDSFHMPPVASATAAHQQLLSPEPRFYSSPERLEDMFAAAVQIHQQIGKSNATEFGAKPHFVPTAAISGDPDRRTFSVEDAQSFAETLRRSSAAMALAVQQQGTLTAGGNRKLSCASSSSFDMETQQQQQQQQPSARYKTELCRPYDEHGTCRYGSKCQFAHGRAELRNVARHPKYKTEMCRTFHTTGYCPYGIRCHFIHETTASTDHQLVANSNTDENGFRHQLAVNSSSSFDEQTHQVAAVALHKDVERRRSTLMQMHIHQMNPSQPLDEAMSTGVNQDRRISVSNYNQAPALTVRMEKASSFDSVFPDVGCLSSGERLPPPPGLTFPADAASEIAVSGQRSTGSSPTSEFTSGFSSGGSSGDVSSGPGSPATALTSAGLQFFQPPMTALTSYRDKHGHPTLSASVSHPVAANEPPFAGTSYMVDHCLESPEVKPLQTTAFGELSSVNRMPDTVLQQQCLQRFSVDHSAACTVMPDSSTPWLPTAGSATVQQIPRDDLDSLQMMASLKPEELAKLIQLVKLCSPQSTSGSCEPSVDVAPNVALIRQNSAIGHQPVLGTTNYGAKLENALNQTQVAPYSNQHHNSTAVCW